MEHVDLNATRVTIGTRLSREGDFRASTKSSCKDLALLRSSLRYVGSLWCFDPHIPLHGYTTSLIRDRIYSIRSASAIAPFLHLDLSISLTQYHHRKRLYFGFKRSNEPTSMLFVFPHLNIYNSGHCKYVTLCSVSKDLKLWCRRSKLSTP